MSFVTAKLEVGDVVICGQGFLFFEGIRKLADRQRDSKREKEEEPPDWRLVIRPSFELLDARAVTTQSEMCQLFQQ